MEPVLLREFWSKYDSDDLFPDLCGVLRGLVHDSNYSRVVVSGNPKAIQLDCADPAFWYPVRRFSISIKDDSYFGSEYAEALLGHVEEGFWQVQSGRKQIRDRDVRSRLSSSRQNPLRYLSWRHRVSRSELL